ncbi:trypsin-like peptidase domain-containing protein [Rubrivirga sp. IMCC43871]|uniref:trypsin-like peptidase domain-containing protein n=1 Tax=Rubrivirga sp. IMCC43871 TaxID=3391575 RepID=UPI00399028CE
MRALAFVAFLLVATAGAQTDPLSLQVFSGVDREAVEAGGYLEVEVEALAVPQSPQADDALALAFAGWDLASQLGAPFEVVRQTAPMRRETDGVVEWQRRAIVRVGEGATMIPELRLAVRLDGRAIEQTTPARAIHTFAGLDATRRHGRSVVGVTAEGEVDGIAFRRVGSAFSVGGDALVTAYHVVVGARRVRLAFPNGDEVVVDQAWALDPVRDVAILHLPHAVRQRAGLAPLVIAPADAASDVAFTAGWPGGVQRVTVAVRYRDLQIGDHRVRVAGNAVRPGDSGGPLLDETGRVLGVVISGRQASPTPDLLRGSIALASDPGPALAAYAAADRPVRLDRALAASSESFVAGRVLEAVGAIQVPARRRGDDRQRYFDALREALLQSPDDAVLQYTGGMALDDAGQRRPAATALDASRRAGYVPAAYSLAHHHLGRGEMDAAAALFGEIAGAEDGPYRRLASFGEAQALIGLGRYEAADAALDVVLAHDARFAPALYLLGIVRLAQGRPAEARALAVRLAARPAWARALRLPVETEALRPPVLRPIDRVAAQR